MNRLKKIVVISTLILFGGFGLVYLVQSVRSAGSTAVTGKAKVLNTNHYLDFNSSPYNADVTISDPDPENNNQRTLSGYAWSSDLGWVEFGVESTNGAVTVDYDTGELSGKADILNTGNVIDFNSSPYGSNVVIDPSTGAWTGFAWAEGIGWIDFSDTGVNVVDDTNPENPDSSSGYESSSKNTGLSSGQWAGDSDPYFEWSGASDSTDSGYSSGILGYCVYFGTDDTAEPATTKGLLGGTEESLDVNGDGADECAYLTYNSFIDLSTHLSSSMSSGNTYYLLIKAVDSSGNVADSTYSAFSYQYDGTNPANPAGLSAPQTYKNDIGSFTIYWSTSGDNSASDDDSGVKGYQYKIGGNGTWYGSSHTGSEDCTDLIDASLGEYTLDSDFDSLTTGENTFYLRTYDNACNVTTDSVTAILKYSGSAPTEPQDLSVDPSTNTENSFAFSWSAPSSFIGQESGLSYCYTVNTVPSATNCVWTDNTSLSAGAYATQPDTNTFYVVAKDEAGNVNYDTYSSVNFTANTSAPGVPRSMDVADISIKATENWKLAVSWEEPSSVGAGVESYEVYRSTTEADCSADMSGFSEIGSTGGTSYTDTGLSQQTYYYCTKACDSANNCSAVSSTVSGYPDGKYTTAAGLTSGPSVGSITTQKATISWSTDRDSDSKIAYGTSSGEYRESEAYKSAQTTDHDITLTDLNAGTTYYYKAKWTDEDGNTGMSEEKSFTTDPAPVVKEVSTTDINLSTAIVNYTVKDASKIKIYYGKSTSFGGAKEMSTSTSEATYTTKLSGLDDGTKYYYKINTFDTENEEYEGEIHSFQTLPRPEVSNVRIQQVRNTAQPTMLVSWQSNTKISSIVTFYPTDDPAQARDNVEVTLKQGKHEMVIRGLFADTQYNLVVKGRDKIGNEARSSVHNFTTATDTRPPQISEISVEGSTIPPSETAGQESKAQLIVSWNTDEPATSQVEFGEGTGSSYSQRTQLDTKLTYNHLVVISGLTPSRVYHLRAVSTDKAGNEAKSIDTVTIAPKATENALNLVITNLQEAFGFLGGVRNGR
jgi:hypothetical protein